VGEKGTAWSNIKIRGVSCHGSTPALGDNAVVKMSRAVTALADYQPEIVLIPELVSLLKELARIRGLDIEPASHNTDELLEKLNLGSAFTEMLRAMTRMTVSPNIISGGIKTNIVPDFCEGELDIRILPGQNADYVLQELFKLLGAGLKLR